MDMTKNTKTSRPVRKASTGLTIDQKLDLIGASLAFIGIALFLTLLSPSNSVLSNPLVKLLRQAFGWGAYGIPLGMVALGGWLLARRFGDEWWQPSAEQWIGSGLLYSVGLVWLHLGRTWQTGASLQNIAQLGEGGGWLGAALLGWLVEKFDWAGSVALLCAWLVLALLLTFNWSLQHWVEWALARLQSQTEHPRPSSPKVPNRTAITPAAAPQRPARQLTLPKPVTTPAQPPTATAKPAVGNKARPTPPIDPAPANASSKPAESTPTITSDLPKQTWELPNPATLLEPGREVDSDDRLNIERAKLIEKTLDAFDAPGTVIEINPGPTLTQFGIEPQYLNLRNGKRVKVKVNKLVSLADDLALALAAPSVRIQAPVPGKGYVGIEVPNADGALVSLRDVLETPEFRKIQSPLAIALGQNVSGAPICVDLASMPHLLIAGTTGSGKSVCVNAIVAALLLTNPPDQLKFIMVDPKRVELTGYNGIPHLLTPVVTDLERVVPTLQWVTREMDSRYSKFAQHGARNIQDFNHKAASINEKPVPFLVVIIDELADLMMLVPEETEKIIARLAQMARATGIHLIIATQRPSVDVVTGLIKANLPTRIAFAVATSIDSRVILDTPGAEKLLGKGDLLYITSSEPQPIRAQGVYVSDAEINRIVKHWKDALRAAQLAAKPTTSATANTVPPTPSRQNAPPAHSTATTNNPPRPPAKPIQSGEPVIWGNQPPAATPVPPSPRSESLWAEMAALENAPTAQDEMYNDAVVVVRQMRKASISLLQRHLRVGYTRAAKLVDLLEENGVVGPAKPGAQQREVLGLDPLITHHNPTTETTHETDH